MNLRLELVKRGKKDDEIDSVVEELRDHLYQSEKRGENVDHITGGSADAYIKTISKEMAFDKGIIRTIIGALFAVLGFFIIPRLIAGDFDLSVERLVFYGLLIVILMPLEFWLLIKMLKKYGQTKQGFLVPGIIAFLGFLIVLGGEFYLRKNEGPSLVNIDIHTSLWLGLILLIIFIGLCVMYKSWFYIGVMVYLVLPDLVARLATDAPANSTEFINISTAIFLMLSIVALVGGLAFYARLKKKR